QLRGGGLDDAPYLGQLAEERGGRSALPLPGQYVRVEQVPGLARPHARSRLRPRLHESLRGQDLDRFALHGPAGGQARVERQHLAGLDVAAQDPAADTVYDLTVQTAARVAGFREPTRSHSRHMIVPILQRSAEASKRSATGVSR